MPVPRLGPVLALLLAPAAAARDTAPARDPARYPAAQCAALWLGQDAYAAASALLEGDPRDRALGEAYRAVAHRQTTEGSAAIDAFIAAQVPLMARLIEDYVWAGNRASRRLYEDLMEECDRFGRTQPETAPLLRRP